MTSKWKLMSDIGMSAKTQSSITGFVRLRNR
jgi:hypothetical protein